jgi:hypothetical protein
MKATKQLEGRQKWVLTYRGSANSSDDIPQPISTLLGRNLRRNSNETSKKQKKEPKEKDPPQKR